MHKPIRLLTGKLPVMFVIACFITHVARSQNTESIMTFMENGPRSNRVNIVIASEGFTPADFPLFETQCNTIMQYIFNYYKGEPFGRYKQFFNLYGLKVPSPQPGIDHPGTAGDESSSGGQPVYFNNSNFNATFDYSSIHRTIGNGDNNLVRNKVSGWLPEWDQIMVLCNEPHYGGAKVGDALTFFTHAQAPQVAMHEFGHSFGFLADEYWFVGRETANMTRVTDPATVKWKKWLGIQSIGIHPMGPSGEAATWFRPTSSSCAMQYNGQPFCAVCKEYIVELLHHQVNMIDAFTPATTSFTLTTRADLQLSVNHLQTTDSTIVVKWYINNAPAVFARGADVSIPNSKLRAGYNTIRADVVDSTAFSKLYQPEAGYIHSVEWEITNPVTLATTLLNFSGKVVNNSGILTWKTADYDPDAVFELEKSKDGTRFTTVAAIKSVAGNQYSYTDNDLYNPSTYYRLKVITHDAPKYYSQIIVLKQPFSSFTYKVYQNEKQYRLRIETEHNTQVHISVLDAAGAQLLHKKLTANNGMVYYEFDLSGKPAGTYFIRMQASNKSYTTKIQVP